MTFEEEQMEVFLLKDFLLMYTKFERAFKNSFLETLKSSTENNKYRLYYYLGWKNEIKFIDYNTFETKIQANKFDETNVLKNMTLNDIVRLNKKENFFNIDILTVPSENNKMVDLNFNDHIKKIIDMRNLIAHEYSEAELKDKHVVEVLNRRVIQESLTLFYGSFKGKLDFNNLTEKGAYLFSNILYLNKLIKNLST